MGVKYWQERHAYVPDDNFPRNHILRGHRDLWGDVKLGKLRRPPLNLPSQAPWSQVRKCPCQGHPMSHALGVRPWHSAGQMTSRQSEH